MLLYFLFVFVFARSDKLREISGLYLFVYLKYVTKRITMNKHKSSILEQRVASADMISSVKSVVW